MSVIGTNGIAAANRRRGDGCSDDCTVYPRQARIYFGGPVFSTPLSSFPLSCIHIFYSLSRTLSLFRDAALKLSCGSGSCELCIEVRDCAADAFSMYLEPKERVRTVAANVVIFCAEQNRKTEANEFVFWKPVIKFTLWYFNTRNTPSYGLSCIHRVCRLSCVHVA